MPGFDAPTQLGEREVIVLLDDLSYEVGGLLVESGLPAASVG
jgi:hypothetical protein